MLSERLSEADPSPDWSPLFFHLDPARVAEFLIRHKALPDGRTRIPDTAIRPFDRNSLAPLHLYLGSPGLDDAPVELEENEETLWTGLDHALPTIPVILSGMLESALQEKLITRAAYRKYRQFLADLETGEEVS